jgi:hypothetical protein
MPMLDTAKRCASEAQAIFEAADREGRALSTDERVHVRSLLDRARESHEGAKQSASIGHDLRAQRMVDKGGLSRGSGPGDAFISSPEYQRIKDPANRGQTWSTGPIQVSDVPLSAKGTLLEGGVGGPGGGLTPPAYEPGVVSKLFEPIQLADLFATSQTTASQVRYVTEGTATSGAAVSLRRGQSLRGRSR